MRILSLAPLAGPGLEELRALGEVVLDPWSDHVPFRLYSPDELIERARGFDVLVVEADFLTADLFERASLRVVGVTRGDPNNVDIAAATKHGVVVINTPARNAGAVADLTLGLMYALLRKIPQADADVRAGRWVVDGVLPQQRFGGRELASCTVGIVGCGAIGRTVAARLLVLDARVIGYDPGMPKEDLSSAGIEPVTDLDELFRRSDIVSLHAGLTPSTRGLISRDLFARAKPGVLLVNTARYGLLDEAAFLDALRDGTVAGAALDHFENEILQVDHPLVEMKNVILTPHIGGTTTETIERHTLTIARGIADVIAGRIPPSVVNPEALPVPG